MHISIKDYQSVADLKFDVSGFTVIVGRSNLGKSALVRAIQGALENGQGDYFVRHGCSYSEVHLKVPDLDLIWKKGGGHNDYWINGKEHTSVGRGCPPGIHEAGFKPLKAGRSEVSVQIADQFSPIFLLDPSQTSGSAAAELVSDVSRLGEVQEALRLATSDKRRDHSTLKVRRLDLKEAQDEVSFYAGLDDSFFDRVEQGAKELEALESELEQLSKLYDYYVQVSQRLEDLRGKSQVSVPSDLVLDLDVYHQAQHLLQSSNEVRELVSRYEGITSLEVPSFDAAKDLKSIQGLTTFLQTWTDLKTKVSSFKNLPHVDDVLSLDTSIQNLQKLQRAWEAQQLTVESSQKLLSKLHQSLHEVQSEVEDLWQTQTHCPVCEREMK